MRRSVVIIVIVLAATSLCGPPAAPAPPEPSAEARRALDEARQAARELQEEIRALLAGELRHGGLAGAVEVCGTKAQRTTRAYRERTGNDVRRVSLRYRNPANAPDPYETGVLARFERLRVPERVTAEHWEVVAEGSGRTLRYLRPVLADTLCLNCHGDPARIPADVKAVLARTYPDDHATGFAAGDVRGAISVRVRLPAR